MPVAWARMRINTSSKFSAPSKKEAILFGSRKFLFINRSKIVFDANELSVTCITYQRSISIRMADDEDAASPLGSEMGKRSIQRSCPGRMEDGVPVRCGRPMHAEIVNPHLCCTQCVGQSCSLNVRCAQCEGWSDGQMEVFGARDKYKKSRRLAASRALRKTFAISVRDMPDPSGNNPTPISNTPARQDLLHSSTELLDDSVAVRKSVSGPSEGQEFSDKPWKSDVEALSLTVANMMKMLTEMRDAQMGKSSAEQGTESSKKPSAGKAKEPRVARKKVGVPDTSGGEARAHTTVPGRQQGQVVYGMGEGTVDPTVDHSVVLTDDRRPPTTQDHQDMEVDGDDLLGSHHHIQTVSVEGHRGRDDLFGYPGDQRPGGLFTDPPVPGRTVGLGRPSMGAGGYGRPLGAGLGQHQGNSYFRKAPTEATVTSGQWQSQQCVGQPSATVDPRSANRSVDLNRSTNWVDTGRPVVHPGMPAQPSGSAGRIGGPYPTGASGSTVRSSHTLGSTVHVTPTAGVNSSRTDDEPLSTEDSRKEEIQQARFKEVLGWLWESFPTLKPETGSAETEAVLSQTQTLAQGEPETSPPSLPWSALHRGIDAHLASQVAGHRKGKRDKPLGRGSLLPGRRYSKVYKVNEEPLVLEPAVPPTEWFQFTGETSSTVGRSATFTTGDMNSLEVMMRRAKVVSNFIDWQMALLSALTARANDQVDIDMVRRVIQSVDIGSTQLAWEVSTALANVQLKRRDTHLSRLSPMVPEEDRMNLRASAFAKPDTFEHDRVHEADLALQAATQRKATLGMLEVRNVSQASYPKQGNKQQKRSASNDTSKSNSSKKKKGKKKETPKKDQKQGDQTKGQTPHTSGSSSRGGGRGQRKR